MLSVFLQKKRKKGDASYSNARVETHFTLNDDALTGSSKKYDENVKANLAVKYDVFDGINGVTHLDDED